MTTDRPTGAPESPPERPPKQPEPARSEKKAVHRPTPVRKVMKDAQSPPSPAAVDERSNHDGGGGEFEAPRTVDVDGEIWTVRSEGATRSGSGGDAGAPLLLLSFARSTGTAGRLAPEREALAVAASLDDLAYDALVELFARSRPYRASSAEPRPPVSE